MPNKVVRPDGTVRVRVIGPGKGSSAVYEADQLKRDKDVFRNAQVFWDHPGMKEERDRPERSLRDLCGVAVSEPVYEENGTAGPGLYTDVRVFKPYQPLVEEMGPHIGISIRAAGSVVTKKVNGESVRVAEKFTSGGFDFVTKAGAGGKVVPFNESARSGVSEYVESFLADHPQESETSESARAQFIEWATGDSQKEEDMELKERVQQLETENAALKEANANKDKELLLVEAGKIVDETLLAESDLADVTRARIRAQFTDIPLKEGQIDKDALVAAVQETVKTEKAYLETFKPKKGVVGMGEAGSGSDGKARLRESLIASYIERGETKETAEKLADLATQGR